MDDIVAAGDRGRARLGASPTVASTSGGRSRSVQRLLYRVLAVPFVVAAFATMPRRWRVGPVTVLAVLTVVQVGLLLAAVVLVDRIPKRLVPLYLPYFGFLLAALFSVGWAPPGTEGIQNGLVYTLFGLGVLLASMLSASDPRRTRALVSRGMNWIFWITLGTVVVQLGWYGLPASEEAYQNSDWFVTPRATAIVLLLPLSWFLSQWYYGDARSAAMCLALLAGQAATLSRMATATGVVLVATMLLLQTRFRPARMMRNLPLLGGLAIAIVALALYYEPVRRRTFTGDTSIEVGGVKVNASGRLVFWAITVASARERPVFGHGLGSSQQLLGTQFSGDISHPHNDYLRLWHDLGAVGAGLLLLAWGRWLAALFRTWYRSERARGPAAAESLTALLAILGVMTVMLTDNAVVYPFVMAPLGVLVGAGLGAHGGAGRV